MNTYRTPAESAKIIRDDNQRGDHPMASTKRRVVPSGAVTVQSGIGAGRRQMMVLIGLVLLAVLVWAISAHFGVAVLR